MEKIFKTKPSEKYSVTSQTQEYNMASALNIPKLIEEVNDYLRQGWVCLGTMDIEYREEDTVYHQALIREVKYKQQSTGPG